MLSKQFGLVLAVLGVGGLVACSDKKPAAEKPRVVRYLIAKLPKSLDKVTLELAGVAGKDSWVDLMAMAPAGSKMKLTYPTPCGPKSFEFPVPATPPNENRVVEVTLPDGIAPQVTRVARDPKLVGDVKLGPVAVPATGDLFEMVRVLDAGCGATVTIDGKAFPVPPAPPKVVPDEYNDEGINTLFITARPEACFLDQVLVWGNAPIKAARSEKRTGASVYWLFPGSYTGWFKPTPKTSTSDRSGFLSNLLTDCPS